MNAPAVSLDVAKRFHQLRRRYCTVRVGIATAIAVTAMIVIWVLLSLGDYYGEWPATVRKTAGVLLASCVAVWFVHRLFCIFSDANQRKFASSVEGSFEEFGQRVRTVLDTVDGKVQGPDEMLEALGHQTLGRWETLSPAKMIPRGWLIGGVVAALLSVGAALGLLGMGGDMRIAMLRILGKELAYTQMEVLPGNVKLLEGSAAKIALNLKGRVNRDVMLRYRVVTEETEDGSGDPQNEVDWIESELLPLETEVAEKTKRHATFESALGKAKQPIEYQFVTSVGTTPMYRIDIQKLIEAEAIETVVQPPAYTQLESRVFTKTSLTVLERSEVNVMIKTNHPLGEAKLIAGKKSSDMVPLEVQRGDDATTWKFSLPSTSSLQWKFTGNGLDGTPMVPVKGKMRIRRDGAPSISWRDPPAEMKAHTLAEIPMTLNVSDDYGIAETAIVFQLGDDEEYVLTDWVREEGSDNTTRKKLEEILPLESLELTEQDYISYYAYAIDNREWGQQRSESDVRYIDIRPLRQFYGEIELEPGMGGNNRVIVQLDEIIRRQRFLINRTRKFVRGGITNMAKELGTIDRMVESQSELAGLTRFLAEFFVMQGNDDVEALNQAEAAMLQASDSLAAGNFELALAQEQEALRALAEARRSLEIFLIKNPQLRRQQAFRQFARQLRQKLRRDPPETEREIADTLQRLAAQQMQLSQTAQNLAAQTQQQGSGGSGRGNGGKPSNQNQNSPSANSQNANNSDQDSENQPQNDQQSENNADPAEGNQGDPQQNPDGQGENEPSDDQTGNQDENAGNNPSENENAGTGDNVDDPSNEKRGGDQDSEENPSGDGQGDPEDERSLEDQLTDLYGKQVDLLERLQDLEDQLSESRAQSPLLAERIDEAKETMDDLATQAREGQLGSFQRESQDVADLLREAGLQLQTLAAREPISRVSSIRDMTAALANMENQLANQMNAMGGTQQSEQNQDNESPQGAGGAARTAQKMMRRAQTIQDILSNPVETTDVETSEVNSSLEQFAEENDLLERLQQSQGVGQRVSEQLDSNQSGNGQDSSSNESTDNHGAGTGSFEREDIDQSLQRSGEYLEAAAMLDELYRQLATPRLSRLRQLEQKASQLAQQAGQGGKPQEETDPETQAKIGQLKEELQNEDLAELAEVLDLQEVSEKEFQQMLRRMRGGGAAPSSRGNGSIQQRLTWLSVELQKQIQEMILVEISADRDAPVPSEYRSAVSEYFRVLAGQAAEKNQTSTEASQ